MDETIKDDDACWCGLESVTYKDCHKDRHLEHPIPDGQLNALMFAARRNVRTCFHPDAPGTCGDVIRAHSLQKSGSVKALIDQDYKVLTFLGSTTKTDGSRDPNKVTWKEASTFYGFCNTHDSPLFAPLETVPFTGSQEQNFLVGYRAICYEMYQKLGSVEVGKVWRKNCDRGFDETNQKAVQDRISVYETGVKTGINELGILKDLYDNAIRANNYTNFASAVVFFDGDISVATTGAIQPDFDVYGMKLQDLRKIDVVAEGLAFGLVTTQRGGAFVFSWPKSYKKCEYFVKMLLKKSHSKLASILVEMSFYYLENTYFSEAWWNNLTEEKKGRIKSLAILPSPYISTMKYSEEQLTDWSISSVIQ